MKKTFPGCLIQIDTKHLRYGGRKFYQFTAAGCFSRVAFCRVYGSAGSACARAFLDELRAYMPFSLLALQTEGGSEFLKTFRLRHLARHRKNFRATSGGSEFLKHFDSATEEELITHYFSHPHCPRENAFVERKIQTEGYELWAFLKGYTVGELNGILDEWNYICDHVRPHQSLGYLTPMEFLNSWMEECKDRDDVFTVWWTRTET